MVSVIRNGDKAAGGRKGMRCVAVAVLAVALTLAGSGIHALPRTPRAWVALAQGTAPVFESADYRIKDGTAPRVVGDAVYLFAGNDPWMPPGENSSVVALDAGDGTLLWQKELEWAGGMGSKACPLYDAGRIYIGCGKSVYCLDAANNGNILWAKDITPTGAPMGNSVIIADPVMYSNAAGTKVVVVGDYIYGKYLGLNADNGDVLWSFDLDAGSSAIGAPGVDDAGNRLYLPQHASFGSPVNGKIFCLDVSVAVPVKKWEYKADYDVAGSVALDGANLYFSDFAYGGPMSNLYRVEDKGNEAVPAWKQPIWGSSGTPLVDANSGNLYVCGNDYSVGGNHFYAFDLDTGALAWDNPNWGAYNGNCVLSPTTGYLYAGSFDTGAWAHNKGIGALDARTGSELWYVQEKGGGDPVFAGGLVYTTADGRLYAYEEYRPSSYDWYFAEGYTGEGFEEWLCLANPGTAPDDEATVNVTYIFNGERDPETLKYEVKAGTRVTIDVKGAVGKDAEVSVKVVSDKPVVAERPVYFQYSGTGDHAWTGGHCVVGADDPLNEWYFAEGYTGEGFEEWLCLANFGDRLATVKVSYIYQQGEPLEKEYFVPGNRRVTFSVNEEAGEGRDVSIAVESDRPVVAERPMYFSYQGMGSHGWTGGHCVIGAVGAGTSWYFAEGYTGEGFEEWLCLANPGDEDALVEVTYLYQDGEPETKEYGVPARARRTLSVNLEAGAGRELGLAVRSTRPVLAERPIYFNYRGAWDGGSCVIGAALPGNYWCLAEGYTDVHFEQYVCISNPGKDDAMVVVTPLFGDGEAKEYTVPAGRRFTLALSSAEPTERAYAITSDRGVVVERAMYFDYQGLGAHGWKGGHCTRGAALSDIY